LILPQTPVTNLQSSPGMINNKSGLIWSIFTQTNKPKSCKVKVISYCIYINASNPSCCFQSIKTWLSMGWWINRILTLVLRLACTHTIQIQWRTS